MFFVRVNRVGDKTIIVKGYQPNVKPHHKSAPQKSFANPPNQGTSAVRMPYAINGKNTNQKKEACFMTDTSNLTVAGGGALKIDVGAWYKNRKGMAIYIEAKIKKKKWEEPDFLDCDGDVYDCKGFSEKTTEIFDRWDLIEKIEI